MLKKASSQLIAALFAIIVLCVFSITASAANIGTVNCGVLNLREGASTDARVIDRLYQGTKVVIMSTGGEWHKVTYNSKTGFLHTDYISVSRVDDGDDNSNSGSTGGKGIIVGAVVNLRADASTSSDVVAKLNKYTQVDVKGSKGDWYAISYNGKSGYIFNEYLELSDDRNADTSSEANVVKSAAVINTATKDDDSDSLESEVKSLITKGNEVVALAKRYLGVPYVYGGTTPNGFDCSGFTQYVYRKYGLSINRTANSQLSNGSKVSKANLQPGDLVFFKNPNNSSVAAGHVGIYVGSGNFIHAPNSNSYVKVSPLSSSYYAKNYIGARRILK